MDAVPILLPAVLLCGWATTLAFLNFNFNVIKLRSEVASIEASTETLKPVKDFVALSKAQRKVIELNKQISSEEATSDARKPKPITIKLVTMALSILSLLLLSSFPGIPLPCSWAFPIPTSSFDSDVPNLASNASKLGMFAWISIVQVIAWKVFQPFASLCLTAYARRSVANARVGEPVAVPEPKGPK